MLKGNTTIFINSKEDYRNSKNNNNIMLLDKDEISNEDSDVDCSINSGNKRNHNLQNHSSTTTINGNLTSSDNENGYEFDFINSNKNYLKKKNNKRDNSGENNSESTINDVDSISSLSTDLSSISVSITNDDDINLINEQDQLLSNYFFNLSSSNENENQKKINDVKDDETIKTDDFMLQKNNDLSSLDNTEPNDNTSINNSSVFLPLKSPLDNQGSCDFTNPEFNIFSSLHNTNPFLPIKPDFNINVSSLNTMPNINMNPINTPISFNSFIKENNNNNIINTEINPITNATNNINNFNNYQSFSNYNNYDMLNNDIFFQNFNEATSSNLLSPFCFNTNNTYKESLNNNFDIYSFIFNGIYPNNTFDLSTYNTKIGINPIENLNPNSSNITSSIPNQTLKIFPFNNNNNSLPNSQLNLINNDNRGINFEDNNNIPASIISLNKQNVPLSDKNLDLLSIVPYPQLLNVINKKSIENSNLIAPSSNLSSLNITEKNYNNILNSNACNINLTKECLSSVSLNCDIFKEEDQLSNKNNKNLNSDKMSVDDHSSNSITKKNYNNNENIINIENNNNKDIVALMDLCENTICNKKTPLSQPSSPLIFNNLELQFKNHNDNINMDQLCLFSFPEMNSSILDNENDSQNKAMSNLLKSKSLTPDIKDFPIINKESSLVTNSNKNNLYNNFNLRN
ncbi:hypothetical protein BCR36DRAFT_351003 [Piromyces finnis]|uniref:Uncharacterized protein n=1 Tax=Piromyces finnis TaxID=1754191 RepID=A0A1Y1VCL0_9FUNG|nr:hypothetical protein BCR36DRAFT_351003 [Piromyces finnis]|eukprot:ORX51379.1 hypothetical protein BCR36DRAFT_351003 [Piromyces finnis]